MHLVRMQMEQLQVLFSPLVACRHMHLVLVLIPFEIAKSTIVHEPVAISSILLSLGEPGLAITGEVDII